MSFKVAVIVALWLMANVPAVAVKVAKVCPASTATDAGIVSRAWGSVRWTVTPATVFRLSLTAQLVEAPDASVEGLQPSELIAILDATRSVTCWEAPFSVAVSVADWPPSAIPPAVAVKVAEELPAATMAEAGTVRAALLLDNETVTPPEGAVWFRVMVQVEELPEAIAVGLHASEETAGAASEIEKL